VSITNDYVTATFRVSRSVGLYIWFYSRRIVATLLALHSSASASLAPRPLRYLVLVSLSCIRTSIHDSASVSPSISFDSLHSPYTSQYHRYSYTPTNLFYSNTQTFLAEQSSLQLYSMATQTPSSPQGTVKEPTEGHLMSIPSSCPE
jgi:hypothetical protein